MQPHPASIPGSANAFAVVAPDTKVVARGRLPLPALTGIRFIAAFYVVLEHSLSWLGSRFALPFFVKTFLGNGYLAVCLFFVLSGFILSYTYAGHTSTGRDRLKFWTARFARIYPVYLLSLVLVFPFEFHGLTWAGSISVLSMVQSWNPLRPEMIGAWNYPAWSLSVEAFFYLCFPFIQDWLWESSPRVLFLTGAFASLLCIVFHTPVQGLGLWDRGITGKWLPLPVLRLPEFVLGMLLGNCFVRHGSVTPRAALTVSAVLASLVLLAAPIGPWVSLVVFPFGLLVYSLAASRDAVSSLLSRPVMVLLGGASYSIYLLQLPVIDWVRTIATSFPRLSRISVPLTPVILVLFSILVFRVWEEPLRKATRKWLLRKVEG